MIDVKKIAKLANLQIKEEELKSYTEKITAVLDIVSQLKEINTEGIIPTSQVTGQENVWREDEVDLSRILKHDKKYFKVKAVLK
ncbi:hypothetical protein A2872_00690 [Candidatus Gottesmanbacteria bacterium RIFCSPHIGHO2_01_FULL_42_12]|uniref:Aspartyl/glutamyl-tRNA(Asn/Gln) amidotransferase subunit C n=1 Tax=Candidatus Gottesmanbacteria bacterium RIFCSPHIGHO2_01_FULL_42_12 TaxID=1798377 RepID=A0A1F5YZI1_9BACT|nr:MAG: hypothetical protein A2872_00690 [Candidatus Gottesmanbacteria bacterium RIFCSPHIGHO2_01_FULL_42_12]